MFLAVDIGNTNITLGVFEGEVLIKTFRFITDKNFAQDKYEKLLRDTLKGFEIQECAIVSVVEELTASFKEVCENIFRTKVFVLNSDCNVGLKFHSGEAKTIGSDRIANTCAVLEYNLPVIVVDIGTAVTFDIVSKDKTFLGGIIMSGINMELSALNSYTSKLPLITVKESLKAIGDTTETCILSGVVRGKACAVEGLISQCEKELGEKAVIYATGGQCELVSKYMTRQFDYVDINLTLKGLRKAYIHAKTM